MKPSPTGSPQTTPGGGLLGRILTLLAGAVLLIAAFMFSLVALGVLVVGGVLVYAYLHWKTRHLRRHVAEQMQEAMRQREQRDGRVIEGELVGGAEYDGRPESPPAAPGAAQLPPPDMSVLDFLDYQPEFRTPIWDYLSGLVDDERVADGQAMLKQWRDTLAVAAERYRVDPATVVAVWGVESNFGRNFGKRPLLTSLSTLSCYGRRQAYFRGEFFDALKIVDAGDVEARAAHRLLGRRLRPHPVHAFHLPAAGRRWRRRRPARPDRQRSRRPRLDRQLPQQGRLAPGRALGLRGPPAGRLRCQRRRQDATSGRCPTGASAGCAVPTVSR
jgi:hypothetical protein